jgi:hypothetical protein
MNSYEKKRARRPIEFDPTKSNGAVQRRGRMPCYGLALRRWTGYWGIYRTGYIEVPLGSTLV